MSKAGKIPRLRTYEYVVGSKFIVDLDFLFEETSLYEVTDDFVIKIDWRNIGKQEIFETSTLALSGEVGVKVYKSISGDVTDKWSEHYLHGVISVHKDDVSGLPLVMGKIRPGEL